MSKPKVSVVVISYNQQDYIREAIESIFSQKTNFSIEVIVADDASSDKTQIIIEEYAKKYPSQLKPILRKMNIGVQPNLIDALQKAKGDYIALCEGDDFWTDPAKLQLQVDFLEKHPDYALCFHPVKVIFENNEQKESVYPDSSDADKFNVNELLKKNFIQTNSVMYRKQTYKNAATNVMPGDWYLHLYHAQFGKIGFINKVMSVYRRHSGGIWWNSYKNRDEFWGKYYLGHMYFAREVFKIYGGDSKYEDSIYKLMDSFFMNTINADEKNKSELFKDVAGKFPDLTEHYISELRRNLDDYLLELHSLEQKNDVLAQDLKNVKNELYLIKSSRVWKARNTLASFIGKKPV